MVEDNTDRGTTPRSDPSILNFIYQNGSEVGFDQAEGFLREYTKRYANGVVPDSLLCMKTVGVDTISR